MNRIAAFYFVVLLPVCAMAQGSLLLKLTVKINKDNRLVPLAKTPVTFTETQTKKVLTGTTDEDGFVYVTFTEGQVWQIGILDIKDYWAWQIAMPKIPAGKTAEYEKKITYDLKTYLRETRVHPDRNSITLSRTVQKIGPMDKPTANEGIVTIQLNTVKGVALSNTPVSLVCYKTAQAYDAKTGEGGTARFRVPMGQDYEIDVDGIINFSYVDLGPKDSYTTKTLIYEPTKVEEINQNDTITQVLPNEVSGTTSRVAIHLKVKKSISEVWANEPIFLEEYGGKTVYKGITNAEGKVDFLLPKGKIYFIHGKFERRIDGIDLTRFQGIGYSNKTIVYRPDPRYQYPDRYIPKPENLINQAFQIFFDGQYPPAAEGQAIRPFARFCGKINANSKQAVLHLTFTGQPPQVSSQPFNVAFVIDRSGSMMGDRIHYVKTALSALVERLRPEDRISIITFNDDKTVNLASQLVGNDKAKILDIISRIYADGGTNISSGLFEGYAQTLKFFKKNSINRVVLLTDGYGDDPVDVLLKKSKEYNLKGIECSAVGVGEDYNLALLTLLASQGGGLIELTKNAQGIEQAFLNEISSLLNPIATDVKVEIEYNKKLLFAQVYGYPLQEKTDGKAVIKLRNVFGGLNQLALVKFTLINPTKDLETQPVKIRVKYIDIRQNKPVVQETTATLTWDEATGELEYVKEANDKKLYAIAVMNQSLKNMAELFHAGKKDEARRTLQATATEIKSLFPAADDADVKALMDEVEKYLDILTQSQK